MKKRRAARPSVSRNVAAASSRAGSEPASWAALFYLAGDVGLLAEPVYRDLQEILSVGSTKEVRVAVQYDGPSGATRYLPGLRPNTGVEPVESLGMIDSGSTEELANFLRWGLSVCPANRVAVVLGGLNALDPGQEGRPDEKKGPRVFTICRDDSSGGYLDVVEIGAVIRDVLAEKNRDQIELLAFDSCHTQFLELAYELEGRVSVLLASQTVVAGEGWDYHSVLTAWQVAVHQAKDSGLTAQELARKLAPSVLASYVREMGEAPCSVSALDLQRLDEVARAFDTLCISFMQSLGEGLIWKARELLLGLFDKGEASRFPAYDCGSFFVLLAAAMDAMADESSQGWLGTTLCRASGNSAFDRFRASLSAKLRRGLPDSADPARLQRIIEVLESANFNEAGGAFLTEIGVDIEDRVAACSPGRFAKPNLVKRAAIAQRRDDELKRAIEEVFSQLPYERQVDFARLVESVSTARRLARQARQAALVLLGDKALDESTCQEMPTASREGMVIVSVGNGDPGPRWSGVSLYRPLRLDALMNESYQRFAFHGRVHWAALLGAANLIQHHPRALWRLVSSLLATGGAGTRRDLLRRLTGADSVVWGLRDQFRAMAPAPTLTLSLERRRGARGSEEPVENAAGAIRENYLLRLDSANRGAIISEQFSRVQPRLMERALRELEALLAAPQMTTPGFSRLRAIGSLLGEDIFQTLGRTLEEERESVLAEAPEAAVHLQLQIPRELMRYPWELLYHRGEWLSERFAIGRQVFMETGLARRVPHRRQGRVRPLIIGDPIFDENLGWSQLPGARAEAEQVAGWFERLKDDLGDVIDFDRVRDTRIHTRLTTVDLRSLLRDGGYDIIHFAGHGVFNSADPETSAWLLSDGELWALEIRNTLESHPAPPWLVYANACEAAMETDRPRYQGSVFGLATAFINHGVSAYIAPLWPIDDLLAQQIAIEFYRQLLAERASLGEALRRAKVDARAVATPAVEGLHGSDARPGAWSSLGWASLVLYGDPTEELFQALAGSEVKRDPNHEPLGVAPRLRKKTRLATAARSFLHAPDHVMADWAGDPVSRKAVFGARGAGGRNGDDADAQPQLELIEDAGLRRWRVVRPGSGRRGATPAVDEGMPGSPLPRLLADDRVRRQLPGRRGFVRVVGRWVLSGFDDGMTGLVREYDREQVPSEGLFLVTTRGLRPLTRENLPPVKGGNDRVLVLVHGTFSKSASPVDGLGANFLNWARERYRAVIAFDHWTLSKTPLDNAAFLAEQLRNLEPELLTRRRLDFITHSRGGLVARAFCDLVGQAEAVRDLVFLGTPNCGTDLANPNNWGAMADALVNMTGLDHAEVLGRLAGLLARLAVMGGQQAIPGILAQNPQMAGVKDSFLESLQRSSAASNGVRYSLVTAEFEPLPLIPNLKGLWKAAKDTGTDSAVDAFFADANDLVVNTAHVWCVRQPPSDRRKLPALFSIDRVLAFTPPQTAFEVPEGVLREVALGIHHCNLFSQPRVQSCLREWLSAP